jgi:hypothetical protein
MLTKHTLNSCDFLGLDLLEFGLADSITIEDDTIRGSFKPFCIVLDSYLKYPTNR